MPFKKLARLSPFPPSWTEFKKKKNNPTTKLYKTVYINPKYYYGFVKQQFSLWSMAMILEQLFDFLSGWNKVIFFLILIYGSKHSSR